MKGAAVDLAVQEIAVNDLAGNLVDEPEDVEILTERECRWLLTQADVGRLAFTTQAMPAILPVHFTVQGDRVIVPALSGGRLATACRGAVVAFEVDSCEGAAGWAVTVVGPCRVVTDPRETSDLDRLGLHPWSAAGSRCYVVLEMTRVTGWRAHGGSAQTRDLQLAGAEAARASA